MPVKTMDKSQRSVKSHVIGTGVQVLNPTAVEHAKGRGNVRRNHVINPQSPQCSKPSPGSKELWVLTPSQAPKLH